MKNEYFNSSFFVTNDYSSTSQDLAVEHSAEVPRDERLENALARHVKQVVHPGEAEVLGHGRRIRPSPLEEEVRAAAFEVQREK